MKIWTSFGSAHSARLSVVGEFSQSDDAALAERIVEDFVNANWEERYPDIRAFAEAWNSRVPGVSQLGPNDREFEMGIDDSCAVVRHGNTVSVSQIRTAEIGGIIKLMLLKNATEIKITGRTGP